MALVIRHFCIEAFRIPTGSMMPTLLGDDPSASAPRRPHPGRQVRLPAARPPPLRGLGLPVPAEPQQELHQADRGPARRVAAHRGRRPLGERGRGRDLAIQRKPPARATSSSSPTTPSRPVDRTRFAGGRTGRRTPGWERRRASADLRGRRARRERRRWFARRSCPIDDVDDDYRSRPYVGDVRVRFDLAVERAGELTLRLTEHGRTHRLVLGPDESYAVIVGRENRRAPRPARRASWRTTQESPSRSRTSTTRSSSRSTATLDVSRDRVPRPHHAEPEEPSHADDGVEGKHGSNFEAQALGGDAHRPCASTATSVLLRANGPDPTLQDLEDPRRTTTSCSATTRRTARTAARGIGGQAHPARTATVSLGRAQPQRHCRATRPPRGRGDDDDDGRRRPTSTGSCAFTAGDVERRRATSLAVRVAGPPDRPRLRDLLAHLPPARSTRARLAGQLIR